MKSIIGRGIHDFWMGIILFLGMIISINFPTNAGDSSLTYSELIPDLYHSGTGNTSDPYVITNWNHLHNVRQNLSAHFILAANLDQDTEGYTGIGDSWTPIGDNNSQFTGSFDGGNRTISNLTINSDHGQQGLFGVVSDGSIKNLTLSNVSMQTSSDRIGTLVGSVEVANDKSVAIENITLNDSNITSRSGEYIGGLIGYIRNSNDETAQVSLKRIEINDLTINANDWYVGGLVGRIRASSGTDLDISVENVMIKNLDIEVLGTQEYVGGIAGRAANIGSGEIILRQLAVRNGNIKAVDSRRVGGLIGRMQRDTLLDERNLFIGSVEGGYEVGGLVGRLSSNSVLNFGYVHADVIGHTTGEDGRVGIITGYTSDNDQIITEIYAVGTAKHATEDATVAPMIGVIGHSNSAADIFEDIYYHVTDDSGLPFLGGDGTPTVENVTELTQAQMQGAQARENMVGVADDTRWDFVNNWLANQGAYPIFKWESEVFDIPFEEVILFAGGDGTSGNPYQIEDWTQLQNINLVANQGHHFILNNDLNEQSKDYNIQVKDGEVLANGGKGWRPIGKYVDDTDMSVALNLAFSGTLDGNEKTISGLRFNHGEGQNIGLFAAIHEATVKNLTINDAELQTQSQGWNVAILAANVGDFELDNVSVTGTVSVNASQNTLRYVGGVFARGRVSGTEEKPQVIKDSDFNIVFDIVVTDDALPSLSDFGAISARASVNFWNISNTSISGAITAKTEEGASFRGDRLEAVGLMVGTAGNDWTLTNVTVDGNISVSNFGILNEVALFSGKAGRRLQLNDVTVNGYIHLHDIGSLNEISILAGDPANEWQIDNLKIDGEIKAEASGGLQRVALVAGNPSLKWEIENSSVKGNIELQTSATSTNAIRDISFIAGDPSSQWKISNTLIEGDIKLIATQSGMTAIGLVAGNSTSRWEIDGLTVKGNLDLEAKENIFRTSLFAGNPSGDWIIRKSSLEGNAKMKSTDGEVYFVGLLASHPLSNWEIENLNIRGDLDISAHGDVYDVGLLAGNATGDWNVKELSTKGNILIQNGGDVYSIGGLIGFRNSAQRDMPSTFEKVYTSGNLKVNSGGHVRSIGGLFGLIEQEDRINDLHPTTLRNAYSTMDVKIEASQSVDGTGGLIGRISEPEFVMFGTQKLTLLNTYYAGEMILPDGATGSGGVVGIVAQNVTAEINQSFWDAEKSLGDPGDSNYDALGKTTAEMKSLATFTSELDPDGWDFENVWAINHTDWISYPYLKVLDYDSPGETPENNPIPGLQVLFAGGNGTIDSPYQIENWTQLNEVRKFLDVNFILINDLTSSLDDYAQFASETANENKGWDPIGNVSNQFSGTFDGDDYMISDLIIKRADENNIGLFGVTANDNATTNIKNVNLVDINIKGFENVGGLIGLGGNTYIGNVSISGRINGESRVGALIGMSQESEITGSHASSDIKGLFNVGGLVGESINSSITKSFYTGGEVEATAFGNAGGIVGTMKGGVLGQSYSTAASVKSRSFVGGLVGSMQSTEESIALLENSYVMHTILLGGIGSGGIVGMVTENISKTIRNSYAVVTYENIDEGGLLGGIVFSTQEPSIYENNFWNLSVSGISIPIGENSQQASEVGKFVGKTTAEMKSLATFTSELDMDGWDFENVWAINPTGWISYPYLKTLDYDSPGETPENNPIPGLEQRLENTIDFDQLLDVVYGIVPFDPGATATSGDQVTYTSSNTDVADIENNLIVIKGVGETTITATLVNSFGYSDAIPVSQELKVLPKSISVEGIVVENKFYDGTAIASILGTANLEGVVGQDDVTLSGEPLFAFEQANAGENINVLVTGWTLTGKSAINYTLKLPSLTGTIDKASLTITADDKQKTYGEENPALSFSYTGLVNGDTQVSSEPIISTTAIAASNVGTYPITLSGGSDDNYEIELKAGTLTIGKKSLTITVDDKQKTYGEENPALTFSYTGLVNGDTKVSIEPSIATTATVTSSVGTYPITLSGGSDDNYEIELKAGTLTIGKKSLTITADDKQKTYGEENPALTFSYSGLVNGDTKVATEPSIATSETVSSGVGIYPITLTGGSDDNYDIELKSGTLMVGKAKVIITADNKQKTYGEANPALTFSYAGLVNGDTELSTEPSIRTTATASSGVGTYPITLTGGSDANYDITLVAGELILKQATLTITASDQSKVYDLE
ncbi:MBG domain-containing protein, partial [Belliella aquatica]